MAPGPVSPGLRAGPAPKPADALTLTVTGDVEPALAPVAGKMVAHFYESYPKLLKRFENPDKPALRAVRLVFAPGKVPGYTAGGTVTVSTDWLGEHPDDIGLLTHELTHVVQAYPPGGPGWLTEGIADYARHLYGPDKQSWKLPGQLSPDWSYTKGYGITARFLVWLDEKHPGSLDKLHRRMQGGGVKDADFKAITGTDLDALWQECVKESRAKP